MRSRATDMVVPTGRPRLRRQIAAGLLALAVAAVGCSENDPVSTAKDTTPTTAGTGAIAAKPGDGSVVSMFAGEKWFAGKVPDTATKADDSKPPLRVGFISADSGPIGALPELHGAADAALAFINAELGGVNGRKIELVPCAVDVSPEQSQTCARKMVSEKVVAVLAGVDIASGDAVKVLNDAGIPWIGGIPLNVDEMASPNTFQFSGGTPGAFVAFADYAAHTMKAKKVALAYLDLPQVKAAAVDYGKALLEKWNVPVTEVTFSITTQDYAAIIQRALADSPDALIIGAADFACPKVLQAVIDLKVKTTTMLVGACADAKWLTQVGVDNVLGTIFNVESRLDQTASRDADNELYQEAMKKYAVDTNALGAATVGFRGTMNFWSVVKDIKGDITPASIIKGFRASKDAPSFDGHPFTCDGKAIPALQGLCAPQQVLGKLEGLNILSEASDGWIDVPAILKDAGIAQTAP